MTIARVWSTRALPVDPAPLLGASHNAAISFFARRELLGMRMGPVSRLWTLPGAQRIIARQRADGSWHYPGGKSDVRSREKYDQLETFRQAATLVEKFGLAREHPAVEHAAEFLFAFQTAEGDFRGIYGSQYATTYVGAIMEVLVNVRRERSRPASRTGSGGCWPCDRATAAGRSP